MNNKNISLRQLFKSLLIISIGLGVISLISISFLFVCIFINALNGHILDASILSTCAVLLLALDVVVLLYVQKKIYQDQLLDNVEQNLLTVANKKKDIKLHENKSSIVEFDKINVLLEKTIDICNSTVVYNKTQNYEEIGITYIDATRQMVEYKSLVRCIPNLILGNEMFRCAFIDFYYETGKNTPLSFEDRNRVSAEIIRSLGYKGILVAPHDNNMNPGILAYVPNFESVSQLTEEVDLLLRKISIIRPTETSYEAVMCRASVVAYPYSDINNIMADIRYATKQNKILSVFLPPYEVGNNDNLLQSTMNLANVTRFLEKFASLSFDEKDLSGNPRKVNKILAQVADYYDFDTSGLIYYNDATESFSVTYEYSKDGKGVFTKGEEVDANFIKAIDEVKDEDMSYYFSSREHTHSLVASYLDYYLLSSGQFYVIRDSQTIYGVVYFLNREKKLNLDAYLREGLLSFSYFISSYSREILTRMSAKNSEERFNDIVRLTNTKLYSIDKASFNLTYISDALKDLVPDAQIRKPCYKVLYGLGEPCKDCPLLVRNRKVSTINETKYETTIGIKHSEDDTVSLLLETHNDKSVTRDRFDPTLLVNTYSSFISRVDNCFVDRTKGYVLFMMLDNVRSIIEVYGNEGYHLAIKDFLKRIRENFKHFSNVYLYREDILAIVLPDADRSSVINDVEKMFLVSKQVLIDGLNVPLSISYITHKYVEEYKDVQDFIKQAEKKLIKFHDETKTDYLYFTETGYSRKASKEAFYLDVIDAAFVRDTFGIRLQPEVNLQSRIISAETFIRLTDTYRDIFLPTGELIATAEKHNKINLITDALIKTIGDLYRDNGYQTFKVSGLTSISINTNFGYLKTEDLLNKLGTLQKTYLIPKDFLGLEFSEEDFYNNKENIKELAGMIRSCDVELICDHYRGTKMSMEELKECGVQKVKLDYGLVKNITTYKSDLDRVTFLARQASDAGIKAVMIGVEEPLQYDLIKEGCGDVLIQGELLCKPVDTEQFIDTLKKMNK